MAGTKKYLLLGAALIAAAAAVGFNANSRTPVEEKTKVTMQTQSALTVAVETVRADVFPSVVTATGTIEAWQEVSIGAEASGLRLTEVLVAEGDHVKAGDVIARLDDTLLRAQLAEQQAAVEQARATLESAQSVSARAQKLLSSRNISVESVEEKATAVKTATAQLAQAEAVVARIQAQLDQTEIHAPFDGIVSTKPAVAGSIVQASAELMKIIRDGRLELAARIPEKSLLGLEIGQAATITDAANRPIGGKVTSIAEQVDPVTRLGTVRLSLAEKSGLKLGMFARVSIETTASRTLSISENAIVWRDGKAGVFVLGPNSKAKAVAIETGARKGDHIAVSSGLSEGDTIVTAGAGFLTDGDNVRVGAIDADTSKTAAAEVTQ